ncbi:hypothetical protein E6C55_22310 [Cohnella fermenti]|uniref:Uncharacterized protein n=1 Tax=Cohnella fermenti TaxID=2565925 RepID=A0A4S4BLE1_9BACL|nr:hypothetical protein E6C55_22310 [Cohnella fermenti]
MTPTEKQVLDLLLQSCTRREIAEKLNIWLQIRWNSICEG